MQLTKTLIDNDTKLMNMAVELFDECDAEVKDSGDRCDMALKYEVCLHKGLMNKKIDIDLF